MTPAGLRIPEYDDHKCGIHAITYKAFQPGCPLCETDRLVYQLRSDYGDLRNKHAILEQRYHEVRVQADLIYAIRSATDLLSDHDREFLKATLYQWRIHKDLTMKTTHGSKKRQRYPNGFLVVPRGRDPYAHICDSVGGTAIATYYQEASQSMGTIDGMKILARGLSELLPGALDG